MLLSNNIVVCQFQGVGEVEDDDNKKNMSQLSQRWTDKKINLVCS